MKILIDFFPLLLFFGAFKFYDIYVGTAVLMGATVVQMALIYGMDRKLQAMHKITLVLVLAFGTLTLVLHDDRFIKWKPTVLYWIFAGILLGGKWIFGRNLIQKVMGTQITLPESIWTRLNLSWAFFFVISGALNLYVAFSGNFTESQWVNFKVFGLMALMLLFVIAQSIWLGRYIKEEPGAAPRALPDANESGK